MKHRKPKIGLAIVWSLLLFGCNKVAAPTEPPGASVELTAENRHAARMMHDEMKEWYAWHGKGIKIAIGKQAGTYEEALYCFHKAMEAWPKELPESADEKRREKHTKDPTDTFMQKGWLYLKMKEPHLAIYYFKRFGAYHPYNSIAEKGIADAEEMLKTTP
jgi:hypothetical protein